MESSECRPRNAFAGTPGGAALPAGILTWDASFLFRTGLLLGKCFLQDLHPTAAWNGLRELLVLHRLLFRLQESVVVFGSALCPPRPHVGRKRNKPLPSRTHRPRGAQRSTTSSSISLPEPSTTDACKRRDTPTNRACTSGCAHRGLSQRNTSSSNGQPTSERYGDLFPQDIWKVSLPSISLFTHLQFTAKCYCAQERYLRAV